jgi:mRNA interferase RelE/StbE
LDKFKIFETSQYIADIDRELRHKKRYIENKLHVYIYPQLRSQPYVGKNIKKLKGYDPDTWRYRIGNYRFFYTINGKDRLVLMIAADGRDDAY